MTYLRRHLISFPKTGPRVGRTVTPFVYSDIPKTVFRMDSLPRLSNQQIIGVIVLGFVLSLIFGVDSTNPYAYAAGIFCALFVLLSVFFLPLRLLIYPLFILIINMLDLTQVGEDESTYGVILRATPWQFWLGPLTPAFVVFLILLVVCLRLFDFRLFGLKKVDLFDRKIFVYFFFVLALVSLWFGFPQEDLARFISDAKVPMFFCIGLVIFGSYYNRYPQLILISCQTFLALAAGHFILDLIYLLLGVSVSMVSGFKNVSVDSGKGLLALMIFWGLGNLLNRRQTILSIVISITSFYLLLSYQTRWLIVTFAIGLLIMVPVLLGTKRVLKIYIPILVFSSILIPILIQVLPEAWEVMRLRFGFMENLGPGAKLEDIEVARAASIYNATGLLIEKKAVLTGMGYGSWYDGRFFPMPPMTVSAFDLQSLSTGRYYRVHEFTFHFLFKFGIIGLYLYLATFLRPLKRIWKFKKHVLENKLSSSVSIILFGAAPLVATNLWFTGKGLLFSALFVSVSQTWAKSFKKSFDAETQRSGVR